MTAPQCPHCGAEIALEDLRRLWFGYVSTRRQQTAKLGGRPPKLRKCPHCGEKFGAAELRSHVPRCPQHPPVTTPSGRPPGRPRKQPA